MNFRVRSDPLEFSEKTIYLIYLFYWNFGICYALKNCPPQLKKKMGSYGFLSLEGVSRTQDYNRGRDPRHSRPRYYYQDLDSLNYTDSFNY